MPLALSSTLLLLLKLNIDIPLGPTSFPSSLDYVRNLRRILSNNFGAAGGSASIFLEDLARQTVRCY